MARTTGRLSWRVIEKNLKTKPRKLQALTWELGTNTLPSIFSGDLLKVYRKFLSPLQGPRNYIDRTWERLANYIARTFSCLCYRVKLKWSSTIDMSGHTPPLICIWLNSSYLEVFCSVLRFQLIYGKQSQAFFKGPFGGFSRILRPTQLLVILLRHFWFHAISRTRKAGACTVISRSLPRWVDIVVWPVQRRFAYRAKFQKLFNDRGDLRSNLGYSTTFLRNQKQQCRNRVHYL